MTIKFDRIGDVTVIHLKGDIDMEEVVEIRNIISTTIHQRCFRIVLDLERVQHINSTGIGILADSLKRLQALEGDLRLAQLNPYLNKVFELTSMARYFKIYKKRQDAIQSFKTLNYAAA